MELLFLSASAGAAAIIAANTAVNTPVENLLIVIPSVAIRHCGAI